MKEKLNFLIVNFFTTLRVAGILLLVPLYLAYGGIALGLTNIACFLSDFIDGKLARKLKASTFFGSIYDAFADKAFVAANFAILCTITPLAIIPILTEIGIMTVQYNKYNKNQNIQSNIFGKAKMWVAGISVVAANFLIDIEKLQFLGNDIINKISSISDTALVNKAMVPVILAELVTLVSYIFEATKKEKVDVEQVEETKTTTTDEVKDTREEKNKNITLTNDEIAQEKAKIIAQQEELISLKEMLFSHEFYMQHKDEDGLKLLREKNKKNKK